MKKILLEFCRRGLFSFGFGPMILAIVYLILQQQAGLETLSIQQTCIGIFSLSSLAFIAGGMNVIYQIERLPLMVAVLIHGCVLYISYLVTYLLNNWLECGTTPILFFTVIFLIGYFAIWAVIYSITKRNTAKLNNALKRKQEQETDSRPQLDPQYKKPL